MHSNSKRKSEEGKSSNKSKNSKAQSDSPMPKVLVQHKIDFSRENTVKSTTPPPETIQEEELENEGPPTPPNYPLTGIEKTPLKESLLFRNIDYTGMSVEEIKCRSARRVIVLENGEEVPDLTWTEFKIKHQAKMKENQSNQKSHSEKKTSEEFKTNQEKTKYQEESSKIENNEKYEGDEILKNQRKASIKKSEKQDIGERNTDVTPLKGKEEKAVSQQDEMILRRSERLAKLKSESAKKRKLTPGKSSEKKILRKN